MVNKFHYGKRKIAFPPSSVVEKMQNKVFYLVSYFSFLFLAKSMASLLVTAGTKSMDVPLTLVATSSYRKAKADYCITID